MSHFANVTDNRGKIAIVLDELDDVKQVFTHNSKLDEDVVLLSKSGKLLRFDKNSFRERLGTQTKGIKAISSKEEILNCFLTKKDDNQLFLVISNLGKFKIINSDELRMKKVGQAPLVAFKNNDKNGDVINCINLQLDGEYNLAMASKKGKVSIIKINPEKLNSSSRQRQGASILINLDEDDTLISATLINKEQEGNQNA